MPALSTWCGIRKPLEDASVLPFLPVGIRERAGLLPWGIGEDTRRTRQGTPLLVSNRSIRRSAIVARDHDIDVTAFYLATPSRIQVMIQTRRGGGSGPVVGLVVKGSGGS